METSLLMSGIGGQGIQFAAQVLARAAIHEGLEVQLFGSYGGMMRGGNTETTLVLSDRPIDAPPTVDQAAAGIVMHHEHAAATLAHLAPDTTLFLNRPIVTAAHVPMTLAASATLIEVPAADLAVDAGSILLATMVMLGAFATVTGLVSAAALEQAVAGSLPSYRQQHIDANLGALRLGARSAPVQEVPA